MASSYFPFGVSPQVKVWALVGMRRYKHELIKYLKWKKHYAYVEKRTVELRSKICNDAATHGTIGIITRELYLKYNKYLIKLKNGRK